jgi:hypothetical protein
MRAPAAPLALPRGHGRPARVARAAVRYIRDQCKRSSVAGHDVMCALVGGIDHGRIARMTGRKNPPVRGHLHPRPPHSTSTQYKHARLRVWGRGETLYCNTGGWRTLLCVHGGGAGHNLVGGIDHGPGSNQPVHLPRMATIRRSVKRSPAVLRCEARQEVKLESLCWLC